MALQYPPSRQGKKAEELKETCMFCCLASDKAMEDIAEHGYRVNPNAGSYIGRTPIISFVGALHIS